MGRTRCASQLQTPARQPWLPASRSAERLFEGSLLQATGWLAISGWGMSGIKTCFGGQGQQNHLCVLCTLGSEQSQKLWMLGPGGH